MTVYGVDTQKSVIESIKAGNLHIDEPFLGEILKKVIESNNFFVTTDSKEAMENADVFIICVQTPLTSDKVPDYSKIIEVCNNSLRFLKKHDLVIIESTISPGIIEDLLIPLIEKNTLLHDQSHML